MTNYHIKYGKVIGSLLLGIFFYSIVSSLICLLTTTPPFKIIRSGFAVLAYIFNGVILVLIAPLAWRGRQFVKRIMYYCGLWCFCPAIIVFFQIKDLVTIFGVHAVGIFLFILALIAFRDGLKSEKMRS